MIPLLSLMIGAYIVTKMANLIIDKEKLNIITTLLAAATILITIYCVYSILTAGTELYNSIPDIFR